MSEPEKPPTVQMIEVASIAPPAWNSRTVKFEPEGADAEFVQSIKTEGIKQPIKVRLVDPSKAFAYRLVFGSRRLAGARAAGLTHVPAMVEPPLGVNEAGQQDAIDNVIENIGRKDLSTYEQARAFSQLRDLGLKNKEVCTRVGVSESYSSRLVRAYAGLHPEIVTAWSKGDEVAKIDFLYELTDSKKYPTKDAQVEGYKARKAQLSAIEDALRVDGDGEGGSPSDDEEDDKGDSKPGPKKTVSVKMDRVKALRAALKKAKQPNITLLVIDFLIGKSDSIKGVIDASDKGE